jgi:hypothetical protein
VDVPTTARFVILSDEETQKILQSGEDCISSECSVDDVASLVEELKMQEGILSERLVKIMNMIAHLQHVNEKKERKTDEVRQFVKDMLRVFSHDVRFRMNVDLFQYSLLFGMPYFLTVGILFNRAPRCSPLDGLVMLVMAQLQPMTHLNPRSGRRQTRSKLQSLKRQTGIDNDSLERSLCFVVGANCPCYRVHYFLILWYCYVC